MKTKKKEKIISTIDAFYETIYPKLKRDISLVRKEVPFTGLDLAIKSGKKIKRILLS